MQFFNRFDFKLFVAGIINYPANICLFKVNNRNTRKRCEICSKVTLKTQEGGLFCCLSTCSRPVYSVSIADLEQANICRVVKLLLQRIMKRKHYISFTLFLAK